MQLRDLDIEKRDARTVAAVILGGGAGTHLFPLAKRRAKAAVSFYSHYFAICLVILLAMNLVSGAYSVATL